MPPPGLAFYGDLGNRLGQADALNRLGELANRTANTWQARELLVVSGS